MTIFEFSLKLILLQPRHTLIRKFNYIKILAVNPNL